MNLIRTAIERPIAVIAAVLMAVMFGFLALKTIPVQLAPDVRTPIITVTTFWPGAAPAEVEREILNRQEDVLKGLEGLQKMESEANSDRAEITLEFSVGQNMDRALLLVANRLDRVIGYPAEVDKPLLQTAGANDNPIAWFVVKRQPGVEKPIHEFGDFLEDVVRARMERVPGVSRINIYGGSERELRITVNPQRMAQHGLTISRVVNTLRDADVSISAGKIDEGKRRYIVRTDGQLNTPDAVKHVLLMSNVDANTGRQVRVTVGDIAEVDFGYPEAPANIRHLGKNALAFNAVRETGANVIATMDGLRVAVDELMAGPIPDAGLELVQVYDETIYINSAIDLVQQNIYIGGTLAALILMLFLRSFGATFVVSIAIPVSVIGAFVAMAAMGRSINVISLAGIAFAVGMVVDAAIVVLENIYRLRQSGRSPADAAYYGASQVWGAVFVSALTTVMVFIPLLVMDLEIGQLFRDIAVAISVAVVLSLIVSITVIPALAKRFLGNDVGDLHSKRRLPIIDDFANAFTRGFTHYARIVSADRVLGGVIVLLVTAAAIGISWKLLPKTEYLPEGNRNLVIGFIFPPAGYNVQTTTDVGKVLENSVRHLWASETGPEDVDGVPKIDNFFFVSFDSMAIVGASAVDGTRAGELLPVLQGPIFQEPGTFGIMTQPSIFGRGIGGGRAIQLDISGDDLPTILSVAMRAAGMVMQHFPFAEGNQMRPIPELTLGSPEVRVVPDRLKLANAGVGARELGLTVDAYNDGLRVAQISVAGKQMDLVLQGPENGIKTTQGIAYLPVLTSNGQIVTANALADVSMTTGPTKIRHLERVRTVTLEIRPAAGIALESALDAVQEKIITPLQNDLPDSVKLNVSGTAEKLQETWQAMSIQLIVALFIVYLVMAVLFESFVYPLVIIFSVPLALAGAVLGLGLLNAFTFQPLDMLTMLGFVILIGIVVNNAILLVHQTLHHLREDGMSGAAAIQEATRNRVRPIFMSTLTSIFGMLPLVVFPGAGSELYRGLGSVVLGGLTLSAVLTLVIIPALLGLFLGRKEA